MPQYKPLILPDTQKPYFQVSKILGQGGFGTAARLKVMKTVKIGEGNKLVVGDIVVRSAHETDESTYAEYKYAKRIDHRNVIQMYSCLTPQPTEPNIYHIFMEYCDLGDLGTLAAKHHKRGIFMPEGFLWHVMVSLARALHRMATGAYGSEPPVYGWEPFVHGDFKPENIFMKSRPEKEKFPWPMIKLGDFGGAHKTSTKPKIMGTPHYNGPERWEDYRRHFTTKADIFSLGVTMWQLSELDIPFDHDCSRLEPRWRKLRPRANYRPWFQRLILRCMAMRPEDRPTAAEVIDTVEEYRMRSMKAGETEGGGKVVASLDNFVMSLRAFGFHQLSPSSYHIPKSKSSLILFFPWLNAAPRHLLKYASLHRDLYPDASTLLFTTSANDFLTRAEFHDSVFNIIPQHERIFVHTMSNGGCYSLTGLALAYKSRTLTKLPTSSMLVDSAPGGSDFPGAYMRAYNALTMDIPHDFTRWPKMLGIGAMAFPRLLLRKMLGMENRLDWIRRDMNDAAIMTQGTRAYVYSMEDAVIDWKAVTAHAQDAKGKGWDVKEVLFEGAHVGHYRQDPERYRGVMKSIY